MSTVSSGYNRFSTLDVDGYLAGRGVTFYRGNDEGDRAANKTASTAGGDNVTLSQQGLVMAAKPRPQVELEGLSYEPMLSFTLDDGSTVQVAQAYEAIGGQSTGTALKVTITRADGTTDVTYIDAAPQMHPGANHEAAAGEAASAQAATDEETGSDAMSPEDAELATMREVIEKYGLGKVSDNAAMGILDAIFARVQAMIKAAEEAKREQETLEKIKSRGTEEVAEENPGESVPAQASLSAGPAEEETAPARINRYTSKGMAAAQNEYRPSRLHRSL